jgi:predicted nucleotidyltransferase
MYIDEDSYDYEMAEDLKKEIEVLIGKKVDLVRKELINPVIQYYAEKDMRYVTKT